MVSCPICSQTVKQININSHLDSGCEDYVDEAGAGTAEQHSQQNGKTSFSTFFQKPTSSSPAPKASEPTTKTSVITNNNDVALGPKPTSTSTAIKRTQPEEPPSPPSKRIKPNPLTSCAPLAERLRPTTLNEVFGQPIVAQDGVLRHLIQTNQVPSLILWGGPGTGKTTIARLIAQTAGTRFVEINSTSTGVAECKKLFADARSELALTGRKTIIFCDELHRFSKSQQDVFLAPVEAGIVTLIGATTENPSFKVINALLSRCRTFALNPLAEEDILTILRRAVAYLYPGDSTTPPPPLLLADANEDENLLKHIARSAPSDARTALTLLSLALPLITRPSNPITTLSALKPALSQTVNLTYDRAGDMHYTHISAFQKSIRGSDPHAALYYLARMLAAGEDALFIARRLVVIASEDIGLADNSMLGLATAAQTACEKVGLPEARINLAHATAALALARKSTRAYRGLKNAMEAVKEHPDAEVPLHLRNGTTKLVREMGWGSGYKYNPGYRDGKVKQEYLPEVLKDRVFLEDIDLGERTDDDL